MLVQCCTFSGASLEDRLRLTMQLGGEKGGFSIIKCQVSQFSENLEIVKILVSWGTKMSF